MEAFERQGNIAEALRVYETLRRLLREGSVLPPHPLSSESTNVCSAEAERRAKE